MKLLVKLLSLLLLCALPSPALADGGAFAQHAADQRAIAEAHKDAKPLYKINDHLQLTRAEFECEKLTIQFLNRQNRELILKDENMDPDARKAALGMLTMPGDDEILDRLIVDLLFLAEAEAQGITIAEQDAADYIDSQREAVERGLTEGSPEERENAKYVMDVYYAAIEGMGVTEQEYRTEMLIPKMVEIMTISAVKEQCLEKARAVGLMTTTDLDAALAEYTDELRAKYPSIQ